MDYSIGQILFFILPFAAFYLGIFIRKIVFPGPHSPSLPKQLLLGIPIAGLVVTPTLALFINLPQGFNPIITTILNITFLIEQGMVMTEKATKVISDLVNRINQPPQPTTTP